MRILVTDASGTIGRFVVRHLRAAGHAVSGFTSRPDPDVELVCAGFDDPVLYELVAQADAVIHLAPVDPDAPGSAGIDGVVRVTDAAGRAGTRVVFPSPAAGEPQLYRQAEALVSSGWAPSLIVRVAPPLGRQLDWMVCRSVSTLLALKATAPLRLLHVEDLVRFLALAAPSDRTGVVDLATADTITAARARALLRTAVPRPHTHRIPAWDQPLLRMNTAALQDDWKFQLSWSAADSVADTVRGLAGRRLHAAGTTSLPGHQPLPVDTEVRYGPCDGTVLGTAAPDGLEGEFDDRVDPRFPVFSATGLSAALPGVLTPMTLDVQLGGLRAAIRAMGQLMVLHGTAADEWDNRAVAVFGHRPYAGVSAGVVAAGQLPGWSADALTRHALDGQPAPELFPLGRPPAPQGTAVRAVVLARALAMLRYQKPDTIDYAAAAKTEHRDPAALSPLPEARLEARIRLLRDRIQQGWCLTARWVIDTGITGATLDRSGSEAADTASGITLLFHDASLAAAIAPLAAMLRENPRLRALAADGDCRGVRTASAALRTRLESIVTRVAHRGPGEAELAAATFGDDPGLLLKAAAEAAAAPPAPPDASAGLADRIVAGAAESRELAYDTTLRFTDDLRKALRELGARRVAADLIDAVADVYYLTCDELLAMPADARLRIKHRRAEHDRLQALRLPEVFDHEWAPLSL